MNDHAKRKLDDLNAVLSSFISEVVTQQPCPLYATLKMIDSGKTVQLAGNAEGLAYFASALLALATSRRAGQHVHLGPGEGLDEADKELVLVYQDADWLSKG